MNIVHQALNGFAIVHYIGAILKVEKEYECLASV